ncbi:Transcriptional activator of fatty acid utilization [Xylographa trunciseda]|nr:Transcriptional activator of fatty acid utilization [Xylographa trunciseda]
MNTLSQLRESPKGEDHRSISLDLAPPIGSTRPSQSEGEDVETNSSVSAVLKNSIIENEPSSGTTEQLSCYIKKRRARFQDVETSRDVKKLKALTATPDAASIAELRLKGALDLPHNLVRDELIGAFYQWVDPLVPVVRKKEFFQCFEDPSKPRSLLLLQAILAAGSTVCKSPSGEVDAVPCAYDPGIYFERARLLYEANYEKDPVTLVQSLILMGWYWEGLNETTKDSFYWTKVAIAVAHAFGLHRIYEASRLSVDEKRMRRRIWWTLLTRDCSVTLALGGSLSIDMKNTNLEVICAADFENDQEQISSLQPNDPDRVQFFLQYAALSQQTALVLSQLNRITTEQKPKADLESTMGFCGMSLAAWMQNCPPALQWHANRHKFWPAILHSFYYTTICLLHRRHMYSTRGSGQRSQNSGTIPFRAAGMITNIVDALAVHDELCRCPGIIVYSLFSAMTVHIFYMRSSDLPTASISKLRCSVCMNALQIASHSWSIARTMHAMFEAVLKKPDLEANLQRVAEQRFQPPSEV